MIDYITIQEGKTAYPIHKWTEEKERDGSRVVTIHLAADGIPTKYRMTLPDGAVAESEDRITWTAVHESERSPADVLADAVRIWLSDESRSASMSVLMDRIKAMREALDSYTSTRNGRGMTMEAAFGVPPDPVKVARHLLDTLTGGALASLICVIRGDVLQFDRLAPHRGAIEEIRSNLRALGEKIE